MTDEIAPQKIIYVYVLTDPRYPDKVRYVGVSSNPKKRLSQHISSARNRSGNHRTCWIKSVLDSGFVPIMTIIDETGSENWVQCEMGWIAYYRDLGCKLVNSTDGGEGCFGTIPSEETRRKMSKAQKGKIVSDDTRHKLSELAKGKIVSDDTRRKLSEVKKGKKASRETRRKLSDSRRGENNHMYGKFHSEEARRRMSESAKGKIVSDDTRRKISESSTNKRAVSQYTKEGAFIRNWNSATEVQKMLGIFQSGITACCRGNKQFAGGYIWRYADDPLPTGELTQLSLYLDFDDE